MKRRYLLLLTFSILVCGGPAQAQWFDPFGTHNLVTAAPATSMLSPPLRPARAAMSSPGPSAVPSPPMTSNTAMPIEAAPLDRPLACTPAQFEQPLELEDAILEALCHHPQTQLAWANARAAAAAVGLGQSAWLPSLNAGAGLQRDRLRTAYDLNAAGLGIQSQSQVSSSRYASLNLSWVLFDFGQRHANLQRAQALLNAANAEQSEILQTVFFAAARAYYGLRDAQSALQAALATEQIASESLAEARAKHGAGVGTLSDQLQAQTAYRRALLARVNAQGELRNAQGTLAVTMGRPANAPVTLVAAEPAPDSVNFDAGIEQLLAQAQIRQPRLLAARARLSAAEADIAVARAIGRPSVALVGSFNQNNPSTQQQPQSMPISASRNGVIGIQLTIPLFEGFASNYRISQARANADARAAELHDTELAVSLEVWRGYQDMLTDGANLTNSQHLLDDARAALRIARGRYRTGVGTFTELLNAQSALADAERQRVLALSRWRMARLQLAASLGQLGLWQVTPVHTTQVSASEPRR